jgi:ABC-type nitrate/sulfonate/bicarbonate transport system ATPase subunit
MPNPRDQVERLLDQVGLDVTFRGKLMGTYSTRMNRRVEIARALMGHPKVLFLDEPIRGLDLPAKREMWSLLRRLAVDENVSTFLSSHDSREISPKAGEISTFPQLRPRRRMEKWKTKSRFPTFPPPRFLSLKNKKTAAGGLRPCPRQHYHAASVVPFSSAPLVSCYSVLDSCL